jgi:hypothetical protein
MGTRGEDLLDSITIQDRNVGIHQELIEILVSYPSSRVTAATFFSPQDAEFYSGLLKNLGHRNGDFLGSICEPLEASRPVEEIDLGILCQGLYAQGLRPIGPQTFFFPPRVASVLQVAEDLAKF